MSLLKKYECKSLSDIVGNKGGIYKIKEWLQNYSASKNFLLSKGLLKKSSKGRKKKLIGLTEKEENLRIQKGNLLITGNHGTGKTMAVNLILKEFGYHIYYFSNFENKSKIDMENLLLPNKKTALIIDELESIIVLNDKKSVNLLISKNNYMRTMPIIVITNNQHNKQLNDTKKHSDQILFYSPFPNEIKYWAAKICARENIRFDYGLIDKFLEHCKGDLRKILIELNNLKIFFPGKIIKDKDINLFKKTIGQKNMDVMLFKDTEELMTQDVGIDRCLSLYEAEKILIPLMIHENYHKFVNQDKYSDLLDIISIADIIDNFIHSEQNWALSIARGIISTVTTSYLINKYGTQDNKFKRIKLDLTTNQNDGKGKINGLQKDRDNSIIDEKEDEVEDDIEDEIEDDEEDELDFTTDLNRTSVKKMNSKNTKLTNKEISKNSRSQHKSIDEFLYMIDIINGNPNLNIQHSNNIKKISRIK